MKNYAIIFIVTISLCCKNAATAKKYSQTDSITKKLHTAAADEVLKICPLLDEINMDEYVAVIEKVNGRISMCWG
jgi:hypothetical protein